MMIRRGKKRQRRGAVAVEMAVVTPLMLTMLFGIIEFGWVFSVRHTMINAAREGARLGSLQGVEMYEVEDRVRDLLQPMGLDSKVSVNVAAPTDEVPYVEVDLSVNYNQISLVGDYFGFGNSTLTAEASMRREGT